MPRQSPPNLYCPDCDQFLPAEQFYTNPARKHGYSNYCKKHQLERDRKHREKNTDKHRTYMREYMRTRAKKKQPARRECNCGNFKTCMQCRNRERERAFRAGEIPCYRLGVVMQTIKA